MRFPRNGQRRRRRGRREEARRRKAEEARRKTEEDGVSLGGCFERNEDLGGMREIRKSLGIIKGIAVDLEKAQRSDKVKELENTFLELLKSYDDCTNLPEAINNVGNNYQPSSQPTDFRKLLEGEIAKLKEESPFVPQNSPLYRQFKEAIWNVHHEGQPMPGEEQEEIVMTSTQNILINMTCPLTGKPVTELENPIRCMDCKHIYEKEVH